MKQSLGFSAWIIASVMVFMSACTSSPSAPQERSTEQPISTDESPGAVQILNLGAAPTQGIASVVPTNTPTQTPLPSSTPVTETASAPTAEIALASPTPSCLNQAEFVKHLNIGDFTMLKSGEHFAKIWQVKNVGTCIWTQEYALIFSDGSIMDGPQSIPLTTEVGPGETIDLRVNLVAPIEVGTFTSHWMLQDNLGHLFGIGAASDQPISVNIVIGPTPMPTPGCPRCQADVDVDVNP